METLWEIATHPFVWGTVFGVLVSLAGGWLQAYESHRHHILDRKRIVTDLFIDILRNLDRYASEIAKQRKHKSLAGVKLFVISIQHELEAYARNRDSLVLVDETSRTQFRELMIDLAVKRGEIQTIFERIDDLFARALAAESAGNTELAARLRHNTDKPINDVAIELDALVGIIKASSGLLIRLEQL